MPVAERRPDLYGGDFAVGSALGAGAEKGLGECHSPPVAHVLVTDASDRIMRKNKEVREPSDSTSNDDAAPLTTTKTRLFSDATTGDCLHKA